MRADKYLWSVRLFKTRGLAAEALKKGRIKIEEQCIKSSREIKPGTEFTLSYTGYKRIFRADDLPKSRVGAKLVEKFLTELTPPDEVERMEMIQAAKRQGPTRFIGRPTKKDRRDLDAWL